MDNNTTNNQLIRNREYAFPEIQSQETIRELLTRKAELTAREKHTEEKLAGYRAEIIRLNALIDDFDTHIAKNDAQIAEFYALAAELDILISEKDMLTAEKDMLITESSANIAKKDALIAELDVQISQTKARIAKLDTTLAGQCSQCKS